MLYTIGQILIFVLPNLYLEKRNNREIYFIGDWIDMSIKIINGMCQDIDKHNAILDSYANNQNGHR